MECWERNISFFQINLKVKRKKMAQILDGLKVSKEVKAEIKEEVEKILANKRRAPHLVAILVGNNGASKAL
jgi:methylenetetrahydrofolate dehydrogenase (NADP+)/methenyltetrahydrofolate cyclohydrolase